MKLKVFTTQREIREFIKSHSNTLLPKLLTIGEFLDRAILSDKVFVQDELRKILFYEACKGVDLGKLGIDSHFDRFLKESHLLYSFFKELFLERVDLKNIDTSDTYGEFSEHLAILSEIQERYKAILESKGLVDWITLEDYSINKEYLKQFEQIEIYLSGYLSGFDKEVICSIDTPITIYFLVTPFNVELAQKMFEIEEVGNYKIEVKKSFFIQKLSYTQELPPIDYISFESRIKQANFVFAKIEEFVRSGIEPEKIVVILPDREFKEFLESFDRLHNLNFAMGDSFVYSDIYRLLEAWYRCLFLEEDIFCQKLSNKEELRKIENFEDLKEFLYQKSTPKELKLLQEQLFLFEHYTKDLHLSIKQSLRLLLDRLKDLSFDDVRGGKITVMEVLESRGCEYDGVIVVDFNEGVVPKIGSEDLFLDSRLRKRAGLPTLIQKESLQKHYYYSLFQRAKRVAIAFVEDEERDVSRFFYELPFKKQEDRRDFEEVLYQKREFVKPKYNLSSFDPPKELSPTALEMLLKCPYRYYLSYIQRFKAPREPSLGASIHSAIQKAIQSVPKDEQDYFKKVMHFLLEGKSRYERYIIQTNWQEPLRAFTKRDFALLDGEIANEVEKKRVFGEFILKARADRVIQRDGKIYIYDYKTNNTSDYYKSYQKDETKLQAEFYSYIWESDEVYFWDLKNSSLQKVDTSNAVQDIQKALENIETQTRLSDDLEYCRYCVYRFGCRGEV